MPDFAEREIFNKRAKYFEMSAFDACVSHVFSQVVINERLVADNSGASRLTQNLVTGTVGSASQKAGASHSAQECSKPRFRSGVGEYKTPSGK